MKYDDWPVALLLAAFCAAVLHTSVYREFERQRVRVLQTERHSSAGELSVALPDLSTFSGQPIAVILRLANSGSTPQIAQVTIGSALQTQLQLAPNRQIRVDLSLPDGGMLAQGDAVVVTGDDGDWSLTYIEVANIHGFSFGLLEFVVVPRAARALHGAGWPVTLVLVVALFSLARSSWRSITNRIVRITYAVLAPLVLLFLAMVLIAPWVSEYAVLLAGHTFAVFTLLLFYPALERTLIMTPRLWQRRFELLYLAACVLLVVSIAGFREPGTGLTSLIGFGDQFQDRVLPAVRGVPHSVLENSSGYDGQFYAQLAIDPMLLDPNIDFAIDEPVYRARRILFTWTAFLLGVGQPRLVLHAYAVQNILFWLALAVLLARWFPARNLRNFCLWFGCMFSHGMLISLRWALPDGPGMLLLALAVLAVECRRGWVAAGVIGLAGLAKDINLLWSGTLVESESEVRSRWSTLLAKGLVVVAPVGLWLVYLWVEHPGNGMVAGIGNFALPLIGYLAKWSTTLAELRAEGWDSYARFSLLVLIGLTIQTIVLVRCPDRHDPWWRVGIASCILMLFLGPAVWESHPGAVTRVLLPMTFAFNILLPRTRWFWPLWILGNLSVLPALEVIRG